MNSKKVLIIDDDAQNIFALSSTLKAKSCECISSLSTLETLKLLKFQTNIDVALIDMMMSNIDVN